MNDMTKVSQGVVAEANSIASVAQEEGGFESLLKFKKGDYSCAGEPVAMGTEYIAHCIGWTRCWIKFVNQEVADRKMYRVAEGGRIPLREELDSLDQSTWPIGPSGKPSDPWVYQYLLPMENVETGDVCIFVTASIGGKRGVADLCKAYSRRVSRTGISVQPVVKLAKAVMPTRMFGDVPRPQFDIVRWTDGGGEAIREIKPDRIKDDMNDAIPF